MNEWLPTLSLALGSAWTSGINLYATVSVLGVLQKFGATKLPGGLDVLDNLKRQNRQRQTTFSSCRLKA